MHPNLLSLMLFCFVTSCTPGPNNILASYSSFNFGIKKTIPHMLGVALGYTSMITVLDVGLIIPFKNYPIIQDVLKVLGSVFLIYLAYKISFSKSNSGNLINNPIISEGDLIYVPFLLNEKLNLDSTISYKETKVYIKTDRKNLKKNLPIFTYSF